MSVVSVRIPTPLRRFTAGTDEVDVEGKSVGEALQGLVARHQDLGRHLFDGDGGLRQFINIYLNDRNVRSLAGLDTPVENGTVLTIVPAVAGGSR
jgi:molybdopterin synthase sulfur carrier subunit